LDRCKQNLEDEKEEGKAKTQEAEDECDEDKTEITRVKTKENGKLEEKAEELGNLLAETINTLEFHKT